MRRLLAILPFAMAALGLMGAAILRSPKDAASQPRKLRRVISFGLPKGHSNGVPPEPHLPRIYVIPVQFPPSATNFHNWDVQESHDFKNWHTIGSNVYPDQYCVFPTSSPSFYRYMGHN